MPTIAGPKLRAGLTDAPLIGIAATWIATSVSGIASSAVPWARSLLVECEDHGDEERREDDLDDDRRPSRRDACVVVPATALSSYAISTTSDAAIAPTTCAIQ